jgi:hypothetical protein
MAFTGCISQASGSAKHENGATQPLAGMFSGWAEVGDATAGPCLTVILDRHSKSRVAVVAVQRLSIAGAPVFTICVI